MMKLGYASLSSGVNNTKKIIIDTFIIIYKKMQDHLLTKQLHIFFKFIQNNSTLLPSARHLTPPKKILPSWFSYPYFKNSLYTYANTFFLT